MGSPRQARPSDRFRAPLERAHGDCGPEVYPLAGCGLQQVLRLGSPLRQGERTQPLGSPRFLAGGLGETGDYRVPRPLPAGRLSAADLHDVGCRRGGGEPRQRLASLAPGRSTGTLEKQDVEQGQGLSPTAGPAPALARGYLLSQSGGNVLLPVQRAGRLQPLSAALGNPGIDDRSGSRDHLAASAGTVPSGRSPSHLRQRAAVHRSRLQRIHPDLRHDSCADLTVLSAVKRENREVAPIVERRVCPPRRAAIARGGAPSGGPVRRPLQSDSPSQRYRLRHASGQAGGTRAANLRRTRSQAGGSAPAAATSASGSVGPAAVTDGGAAWRFLECGAKLISPGETEAGSAGDATVPRDNPVKLIEDDERGTVSTAVLLSCIGFDRFPHALKIPAPKGRNPSYRKPETLHFTLNQDTSTSAPSF